MGVPRAPATARTDVVLSQPEDTARMPVLAAAPARWPARNWKQRVCWLLAAAAVPATLLVTTSNSPQSAHCSGGVGVEQIDGECIGVNGQGYNFGAPEIEDVSRAIALENRAIQSRPHVTVAVMLPLDSGRKAQRSQTRGDLQGAYLGQREANARTSKLKIRLVLANPGRDYGQQEKVVDTLLELADSRKDRLRAVTGFSSDSGATAKAVKRLTENKIPVLASQPGGDNLSNEERRTGSPRPYPGLARVGPTDRDAARALADFSSAQDQQDKKTFLVYDKRGDNYSRDLREAFAKIGEKDRRTAMPFASTATDQPGSTPNQFATIVQSICATGADTVYFAGRAADLRAFALSLAQAPCETRHFTVVSSLDATSLPQSISDADRKALRGDDGKGRVTFRYAAPAHPDTWESELARWRDTHDTKPPTYLTQPAAAMKGLKELVGRTRGDSTGTGSAPDLVDSRTVLFHDGLIALDEALQRARGDGEDVPPLTAVRAQWTRMHGPSVVRGASGLICLTASGNAYNKPVPVVELDPGSKNPDEPKYVGLGWPEGKAPPQGCSAPGGR